jgi:hypothetical protein
MPTIEVLLAEDSTVKRWTTRSHAEVEELRTLINSIIDGAPDSSLRDDVDEVFINVGTGPQWKRFIEDFSQTDAVMEAVEAALGTPQTVYI